MDDRNTRFQPAASKAALHLSDVCLRLDDKLILDGISFDANERRIGIVGRNGSGKTTLARVMAGLIAPTEGVVEIAGIDVLNDRKAAIGKVGILFQNPDHQIIFPTVEEELAFGLTQLGLSKAQVAEGVVGILRLFEKEHWAKAAVYQLSQGQKQLVCLMSILAMKPEVIILDEPFSGLDIPTKAQLSRYLDRAEARLVHITHDPACLAGYDRVIWLEQGRVAQDGPAAPTLGAFTQRMNEIGEDDDISDLAS
ncbi:energy-coupling factor ABC transporter ATP-binding protein [Actibacterium lipolyticum]